MRTYHDVNLKKIILLMLAILCLTTLLSLLPDQQRTTGVNSDYSSVDNNPQVLAERQAYLLHRDNEVARTIKQF